MIKLLSSDINFFKNLHMFAFDRCGVQGMKATSFDSL